MSMSAHPNLIILAAGLVILGVAIAVLYRARLSDRPDGANTGLPFKREIPELSAELKEEVARIKASGHTIDAIKLVRSRMHLGLNDAKRIVDNLE